MNGCKAASDLALIQTSLPSSHDVNCVVVILITLTLEKHKGLYQSRVTGSLAAILRPGNLATTVKWSILELTGKLMLLTIHFFSVVKPLLTYLFFITMANQRFHLKPVTCCIPLSVCLKFASHPRLLYLDFPSSFCERQEWPPLTLISQGICFKSH